MPLSFQRETAISTYPADLQIVGNHDSEDLLVSSIFLLKPSGATHLKLQALVQNIRYRIDTLEATLTTGFQLTAGSDTMMPVPLAGVSIIGEASGANVQFQWVK